MIKNECEIVRDLMPNYVENQIGDNTKEFVEEHLEGCRECKEILEALQVENKEALEKDEINFLKKFNKKMTIFKVIATVLSVIILAMWTILSMEYITKKKEEKKAQYISEIVEKAYLKIEDIKQEILNGGNYKIIEENTNRNYDGNRCSDKITVFYKDLKYKEETDVGKHFGWKPYTDYGVILGKNKDNKLKSVYVQYDSNFNYIGGLSWGLGFSTSGVDSLGSSESNPLKYISEYDNFDIMEETYDGKEYYILREYTNNIHLSYIDRWIRKEDMLLIRVVYVESGIIQNETKYTWEANSVTDEDVKIKDKNVYEELQNKIKELKLEESDF